MRKLPIVLVTALGLAACGEGSAVAPPTPEQSSLGRLEATLSVSSISAFGFVQQAELAIRGATNSPVRVVVGPDCQSGEHLGSPDLNQLNQGKITLSASGLLASDGNYTIHVCQDSLRSTVHLRVDNTQPIVTPNIPSATYCGSQRVTFACSDCTTIAWSTTGAVSFGADGLVTAGQAWDGQAIYVGAATTLHYAGIDAVGNVQPSATLTLGISPLPAVTSASVSDNTVSGDLSSTQTTFDLSATTQGAAQIQVRAYGTGCQDGGILASEPVDVNGDVTLTLEASFLQVGTTPLLVCAVAATTCATREPAVVEVTRRDAPVQLQLAYPASNSVVASNLPYLYFSSPEPLILDAVAPTAALYSYWYGYNLLLPTIPALGSTELFYYSLPTQIPENVYFRAELTPNGARDPYGNILGSQSFYFQTTLGRNWPKLTNTQGYDVSANTVVTDYSTSITWKACVEGLDDGTCAGAAMLSIWDSAVIACHQRATAGFASGDYWRLPTIRELLSLVDYSAGPPYVPTGVNLGTAQYLWSSTVQDGLGATVWGLDTFTGAPVAFSSGSNLATLCIDGYGTGDVGTMRSDVRSTYFDFLQPSATGEIIHHPATGLLWQQSPSETVVYRADAASACAGLRHGLDGWRLPTPVDIASLVQWGSTALDVSAFNMGTSTSGFWVEIMPNTMFTQAGGFSTSYGAHRVWCVHDQL